MHNLFKAKLAIILMVDEQLTFKLKHSRTLLKSTDYE